MGNQESCSSVATNEIYKYEDEKRTYNIIPRRKFPQNWFIKRRTYIHGDEKAVQFLLKTWKDTYDNMSSISNSDSLPYSDCNFTVQTTGHELMDRDDDEGHERSFKGGPIHHNSTIKHDANENDVHYISMWKHCVMGTEMVFYVLDLDDESLNVNRDFNIGNPMDVISGGIIIGLKKSCSFNSKKIQLPKVRRQYASDGTYKEVEAIFDYVEICPDRKINLFTPIYLYIKRVIKNEPINSHEGGPNRPFRLFLKHDVLVFRKKHAFVDTTIITGHE